MSHAIPAAPRVRSLAETRALLGPDSAGLSDAEVLAVRDAMYAYVQALVGYYQAQHAAPAIAEVG